MKKDILLFACIEKNIGDDLFIETVCKRYTEQTFIISKLAKYGTLKNIENLKFSRLLYYWQVLSAANPKSTIKKAIIVILDSILRCLLGNHEMAVYIVGNAFKNTNYLNKSQLGWLEKRMSLADEFYILSTNFGPYNDERWLEDTKSVFKNVTDICFRDKFSYNLFSELKNVRVAPDAILSLKVNRNNFTNNKNIIVSVIDCSFKARDPWLKALSNDYDKAISELINELIKQDYSVTLLNSNAIQDRPASDRIKNICNNSESIKVFDYEGNLDELRKLFYESAGVIGTRLHTIVLAWLYGLPVLPIVYDLKVSSMMEECKYNGKYVNIKSIKKVSAKEMYDWFLYNSNIEVDHDIHLLSNKQFEALDKRLGIE